jgi:hypothetical protein
MSRLSEERTRTIESKLRAAGASLPCPRCGLADSTVLDGYLIEQAQSQLRNLVISGDNRVSCVATVCRGCGYLAQHLIDLLDLDEV